ncbi:MAG: PIG-L family deacetylase [Planctomycetota bacterium]|nr:MAG: PIG-L family deacetylase [Planctomycetota bacterium]
MRLDFSNERILAVVAHPDDAELLCGGTLARAAAEGAAVGWVVCCRGDKGVPRNGGSEKPLAEVRRKESEAAAAVIGAEVFFLGAPDGELQDTLERRRALTDIFRRFQPTLVLAHSEHDYHPDHRAAAQLVLASSWFAASPAQRTGTAPLRRAPAVWEMDTVAGTGFLPEFAVDITAWMEAKRRMLGSHRSQLQRAHDTDFAPLDVLMERLAASRGQQFDTEWAEAFRWSRVWKRCRAF